MDDSVEARVAQHFRASPERVFDGFVNPDIARRWSFAEGWREMLVATDEAITEGDGR